MLNADPLPAHPKMAKPKGTMKQVKNTTNKPKANQQASRSGDQPKKGIHCQKHPASDGSDDSEGLKADPKGPCAQARKKMRCVGVNTNENEEEVEDDGNEEEVEHVVDRDDDVESADVKQVSSLLYA
jgi:hypothetical protein